MESEREISAASTTPAVCAEQSNSEADEGIHSGLQVSNQIGEDEESAPPEVSRKFSLPFDNLPDVEHKNMEMVLTGTKERFEKLQFDLVTAEKKLADSQKEHLEEVSFLRHKLQSSVLIGEDKIKSLESEGARLVEELNASKDEVSDQKRYLQSAKQDHGELVSQVNGLKETVHMLEKQLEDLNEQAKETKENLSVQVDACQAELSTKVEALESISKVHRDLQLELKEVKSKSEESVSLVKERVFTLEGMLESAQDEIKAKEAAASLLQAENANLMSKISELSTASEERLKQFEEEHQEQLKAHEKRCDALQKSLSKLEERSLQLQDSLSAARSDAEIARGKVADLELELENLLQTKREFEQGASELRLQLKSMEDMVSKQVDSLKIAEENADTAKQQVVHLRSMLKTTDEKLRAIEEAAEENADTAKQQVVHLQSMLKTTNEKLRASEEAAVSLQQQVVALTFKEARSAEHLKEVEDGSQMMQLEFQSKLGTLEATMPQLEEKVAQLQDLLSAAELDGDGARKKVRELEVELASLHKNQGELVEKVKFFEDKCSQHESTTQTLHTRVMELEGLITEFKSKAVVMNGKVATLEAALVDSQNKVTDLEIQLRLAKDNSLLLENRRIVELEKGSEEYVAKIEELHSMLAERQKEISSVTNKTNELKLSIGALESDLKSASEREMLVNKERTFVEEKLAKLVALTAKLEAERSELESSMHQHKSLVEKGKIDLHEAFVLEKELRGTITTLQAAMPELQGLLIQTEEEKQAIATQLESTMKNFAELNDQLVEERRHLQQQIATIMQENEDLRQKIASAQEKLHVALAAAELSAKQVQEGSLKESILRDQVEDLKLRLKNAHYASVNVETLEQEKGNLAQKFASTQEKLQATFEAAELSARELQAASLKELTLNAEIEDLKIKAMDACCHVERLEQTLENSITREEHQTQIDQVLAASRLAESKLSDVEEQLKSKLEMKDVQNSVSEHETHVRELDSKTVKVFEQLPLDSSKMREMDLDVQSPGKVRNRKKKGVTWETDAVLKPKAVHKPQQYPVHSLNQYVAHIVIALVSLTIGFWLASTVHS